MTPSRYRQYVERWTRFRSPSTMYVGFLLIHKKGGMRLHLFVAGEPETLCGLTIDAMTWFRVFCPDKYPICENCKGTDCFRARVNEYAGVSDAAKPSS